MAPARETIRTRIVESNSFLYQVVSIGKEKKVMAAPTPINRRLISIQEAATYTSLSVNTLYKMISRRAIPFVKVGRLVKFDLAKLDEWITKQTVMPMPEKRG